MGLYKNTKLLELAKSNLRLFGRVGNNERLMTKEGEPRQSYKKLTFLEKNPDIKLVILDPAADYMAGEEEKDPAQAKDWTKLLSALTLLPGAPTILAVAHHTRKDSNDSSVFKASEKIKSLIW